MIARDIILFLLLVIVPFIYFDLRYFRKHKWWKRIMWWMPCVAMVGYTVFLAQERDFIPGNERISILYGYLSLLALVIVPMLTYILCA